MNLVQSLGLVVLFEYQQERWHCELRATLLRPPKAWGGAGDRMEDAANEAVHAMLQDVLAPITDHWEILRSNRSVIITLWGRAA